MNNKHIDWDAIFRYLNDTQNDQLRVVMELKIEDYAKRHEDPIEAQNDVEKGIRLLEEGHLLTWTRLRGELEEMFAKDQELELLFIEAAKSKGIEFELLVAHLS